MKTTNREGIGDTENWDGSKTPKDPDSKRGVPQDTEKFPKFDISGRAQTNNKTELSNLGKKGNPFLVRWLRDLDLILVGGSLCYI